MEEFLANYISMGGNGIPNPFTLYLFILLFANTCRFLLVIRPLWKLSKKYDRKWRREMFFGSKTNPSLMKELLEGQMDPIKGFLVRETIYLSLPMLAAISLRLFFGDPEYISWFEVQLILFALFMSVWIAYDVNKSIRLRKSIRKVEKQYSMFDKIPGIDAPTAVKHQAKAVVGLRGVLRKFIEKNDEKEYHQYAPLDQPDDRSAFMSTLAEMGNVALNESKNLMVTVQNKVYDKAVETDQAVSQKITEKVNEIINPDGNSRYINFLLDFFTVIGPLLLIFMVLPWYEIGAI